LTRAKPIHERQTCPLIREDYDCKGSVMKKTKKKLVVNLKGLGAKAN
jgi:hypothetical protein